MPLLDHFHPPLAEERHWEAFHSAWANAVARELNENLLPAGYFAEPQIRWGSPVEIDVATLESRRERPAAGTATLVWSPAAATLSAPVDFVGLDLIEVQIIQRAAGPKLVAAIEFVSPANKDRPSTRRAFAVKCAAYLQSRVSVVVVDVVTERTANLHAELLELLQIDAAGSADEFRNLFAAAYRSVSDGIESRIEAWSDALIIGEELPTLPLWISEESALPLDLEQSYSATCRSLRIE